MKKWTLGLVFLGSLFLSTMQAEAAKLKPLPPWFRTCLQQAGGEVWIGEANDSNDEPMLCLLDSAAIGAEALFIYKTEGGNPQAVSSYLSGARTCAGKVSVSSGADGRQFQLCTYGDGSVIGIRTLQQGFGTGSNQKLDAYLQN